MPFSIPPTYAQKPTVGQSVLNIDNNDPTCTVTSIIRYNGNGYFVCGVHSSMKNEDYQMDVWYDVLSMSWKCRKYVQQNRFPDLDGTVKNM